MTTTDAVLDALDKGLEEKATPLPDPQASAGEPSPLRGLEKLPTIGDRGWLDPSNPPPSMPALLTCKDARDKDALFLPLGRTAMLAGPGGTGKTQAIMQLAVSVATGRAWLGAYAVAAPGPVLVMLGEEDEDEFHRRLWRCADAMELWDDAEARGAMASNIHPLPLYGKRVALQNDNGDETPFTRDLHRLMEGKDWRLVILDPASRFMGAECETDNKAATTWIECLERITECHGKPSLLFGHHTNKVALTGRETDQGAARGSSALTDGARWQANMDLVFEIESDGDGPPQKHLDPTRCTLRVVKRNYGPPTDALELTRDIDHGGYLRPTSGAELEVERASGSKGIAKLEAKLPALKANVATAKTHLEEWERKTAQGSLDEKAQGAADRERGKLERAVRDEERKLEKLKNKIAAEKEAAAEKPKSKGKGAAGGTASRAVVSESWRNDENER